MGCNQTQGYHCAIPPPGPTRPDRDPAKSAGRNGKRPVNRRQGRHITRRRVGRGEGRGAGYDKEPPRDKHTPALQPVAKL